MNGFVVSLVIGRIVERVGVIVRAVRIGEIVVCGNVTAVAGLFIGVQLVFCRRDVFRKESVVIAGRKRVIIVEEDVSALGNARFSVARTCPNFEAIIFCFASRANVKRYVYPVVCTGYDDAGAFFRKSRRQGVAYEVSFGRKGRNFLGVDVLFFIVVSVEFVVVRIEYDFIFGRNKVSVFVRLIVCKVCVIDSVVSAFFAVKSVFFQEVNDFRFFLIGLILGDVAFVVVPIGHVRHRGSERAVESFFHVGSIDEIDIRRRAAADLDAHFDLLISVCGNGRRLCKVTVSGKFASARIEDDQRLICDKAVSAASEDGTPPIHRRRIIGSDGLQHRVPGRGAGHIFFYVFGFCVQQSGIQARLLQFIGGKRFVRSVYFDGSALFSGEIEGHAEFAVLERRCRLIVVEFGIGSNSSRQRNRLSAAVRG